MSTIKTVVQITSKTTPVVGNYKNFIIQTVPLTDAVDTSFAFDVKCDQLYPEQNVQLTPIYAGTGGFPVVALSAMQQGLFTVRVNNAGILAFNGVLKINVSVINA